MPHEVFDNPRHRKSHFVTSISSHLKTLTLELSNSGTAPRTLENLKELRKAFNKARKLTHLTFGAGNDSHWRHKDEDTLPLYSLFEDVRFPHLVLLSLYRIRSSAAEMIEMLAAQKNLRSLTLRSIEIWVEKGGIPWAGCAWLLDRLHDSLGLSEFVLMLPLSERSFRSMRKLDGNSEDWQGISASLREYVLYGGVNPLVW